MKLYDFFYFFLSSPYSESCSLFLKVFTYVKIPTDTPIYIYLCMYLCICIYTYIYVCIYVCMHACASYFCRVKQNLDQDTNHLKQ